MRADRPPPAHVGLVSGTPIVPDRPPPVLSYLAALGVTRRRPAAVARATGAVRCPYVSFSGRRCLRFATVLFVRRVRAGSAMGPAMSECLACVTSANTTRKGGRPLVTSAAGFTAGREFLGRRAAGYLDSVGWGNRPPDGRAGEGRWTYEPHTHTGHGTESVTPVAERQGENGKWRRAAKWRRTAR